jgi:hypothetical protein
MFGRRQRAQEIAEIVGERMKLKTDGVGGERSCAGCACAIILTRADIRPSGQR